MLRQIVERVSGKRYAEFLKKKIFDALGMQDTLVLDERKLQALTSRSPTESATLTGRTSPTHLRTTNMATAVSKAQGMTSSNGIRHSIPRNSFAAPRSIWHFRRAARATIRSSRRTSSNIQAHMDSAGSSVRQTAPQSSNMAASGRAIARTLFGCRRGR